MTDPRRPPFGAPRPERDAGCRRSPEEIEPRRAARADDAWRAAASVGRAAGEGDELIAGQARDAIPRGRGADRRQRRPAPVPLPTVGPGARKVMGLLARAERTTLEFAARHGFASDYDVPFNYGRSGPPLTKPLSQMTLDEIDAHQTQMRPGGSTAVGRYQFKQSTLGELVERHGLAGDRLFDGALQDALTRSKMCDRKYDAYGCGAATADQVMDAFAAEWASLPMPDGLSRYSFQGRRQPVRVTRGELKAVLDEACALDFGAPPGVRPARS